MSGRDDAAVDPRLDRVLRALGPLAAPEPEPLDELFGHVQGRIRAAESRPGFFLATRSTTTRVVIAIASFFVLLGCTVAFVARPDLGALPLGYLLLELGALGVLLVTSVVVALRPLQRAPLPRFAHPLLLALVLLSTLALSLLPPPHFAAMLPEGMPVYAHAPGCLLVGILFGLPVYALLRLLDRGTPFSSLLAAGAAGLAANALLSVHCPVDDPVHTALGHFPVAVAFVAGLVGFELLRAHALGPRGRSARPPGASDPAP